MGTAGAARLFGPPGLGCSAAVWMGLRLGCVPERQAEIVLTKPVNFVYLAVNCTTGL